MEQETLGTLASFSSTTVFIFHPTKFEILGEENMNFSIEKKKMH